MLLQFSVFSGVLFFGDIFDHCTTLKGLHTDCVLHWETYFYNLVSADFARNRVNLYYVIKQTVQPAGDCPTRVLDLLNCWSGSSAQEHTYVMFHRIYR